MIAVFRVPLQLVGLFYSQYQGGVLVPDRFCVLIGVDIGGGSLPVFGGSVLPKNCFNSQKYQPAVWGITF